MASKSGGKRSNLRQRITKNMRRLERSMDFLAKDSQQVLDAYQFMSNVRHVNTGIASKRSATESFIVISVVSLKDRRMRNMCSQEIPEKSDKRFMANI